MAEHLMILGAGNDAFLFSISTAAYSDIERQTSYSWQGQGVVGGSPVLQFTGKETETITMRGTIFPTADFVKSPYDQLPKLRTMADKGIAYALTSGTGQALGRWVIERVNEKVPSHFADGTARKIEFDLTLKQYASR